MPISGGEGAKNQATMVPGVRYQALLTRFALEETGKTHKIGAINIMC